MSSGRRFVLVPVGFEVQSPEIDKNRDSLTVFFTVLVEIKVSDGDPTVSWRDDF
jgi:hypothetical protein